MSWTERQNEPLSPVELEILLHYHYSPMKYRAPFGLQGWRRVMLAACSRGIASEEISTTLPEGRTFKLTDRGERWIEMILATPMPVRSWIDPREEVKK